mgnify:CR=1 FL=1
MLCAMCLTELEPHNPNDFCSIECYKEFKEMGGSRVKVKVKLDETILWCCEHVLIRPFPASYVMNCPKCGERKPCQSTNMI